MILDNEYETLTIKDKDGHILIRNIDEYNLLKYDDFKGERIIKTLSDGLTIQETFNDGIFNIEFEGHKLQSRNKIEVAKRLKYCLDNDTSDPLKELLLNEITTELKESLLTTLLSGFGDRLSINKDEIIIDEIFKVDKDGQAYFKQNKDFKFLCIVVPNDGNLKNKVVKHELGELKIDFKTMEIYSKVLFLLFPNLNDSVFMNQLPENIKKYIKLKAVELYE